MRLNHQLLYTRSPFFSFLISVFILSLLLSSIDASDENKIETSGGLRWNNLFVFTNVVGPGHKKKKKKLLLHPSCGFAPNGTVTAIIGPSGAGKSTLLAALSGTTPKGTKSISGHVWLTLSTSSHMKNDERTSIHLSVTDVALLRQHDTFFSMLTPRETIKLATFLQLDLNEIEQEKLIDSTIDKLGLRNVQYMRIGDHIHEHSHGCLSGGERRRLGVALELVSNPKVFIADEPTTGLDSTQAQKVFQTISNVARERNIPCICSLHQPPASMWKNVDFFILMASGGRIVYHGHRDSAIEYFAKLGYQCPVETTPAEFFVDLVTIDTEDEYQAIIDRKRINFLSSVFEKHQENRMIQENNICMIPTLSSPITTKNRHHRSFPIRISALFLRSLRQNLRDTHVNILRTIASIGLARLFSELFHSAKKGTSDSKSVADRTALLSYGVINMTMMSMTKTLNLFGREKGVVLRERMRQHYTGFDYLLSKILAEIPLDIFFSSIFAIAMKHFTCIVIPLSKLIAAFSSLTMASASIGFAVGSFTSNVEQAMTVGLPLMTVLMAVGVINPSGVDTKIQKPFIIKILKIFSPIAAAIEALCIGEYKGMKFGNERLSWWRRLDDLPKMGGLALVKNGDQVLDALGISEKTFMNCIKDLGVISGISLICSWVGLKYCGNDFQQAQGSISLLSDDFGALVDREIDDKEQTDQAEVGKDLSRSSIAILKPPIVRGV